MDEGKFLFHTSCPKCGSKDNVAVYENSDGSMSAYCFTPGCNYFKKNFEDGEENNNLSPSKLPGLLDFQYSELRRRGITKETCKKMKYGVGRKNGEPVQIANYTANGTIVAQKTRNKDKQFRWVGEPRQHNLELFGQSSWPGGGKRVVVTEGEIDALSVAQAFQNNWQAVSVPSANEAKRAIKKNLQWLESFEEIVLAFDNDDVGRQAVEEAANLFTPGKVSICNWGSYKDANEVLVKEGEHAVGSYIFGAEPYRPDGIQGFPSVSTLRDTRVKDSYNIKYPDLQEKLQGLRKGEITLVTAGTGIGKSTFVKELGYGLLEDYEDVRIGVVALEESIRKTALSFIGIDNDVRAGDLFQDPTILSEEEFEKSYNKFQGRLYFYDHFGSLEGQNLLNKLKYLVIGLDVDFIILDHISIVVSGISGGDERRIIDNLMTDLRSLAEQTNAGLVVVSHLKSKDGTPYEEGAKISLNDLRGSRALSQISDNVVALERNQQDKENPNLSTVRVLKNRLFGELGEADTLFYTEGGRLVKQEEPEFENEEEKEDAEEFFKEIEETKEKVDI